MYDKNRAEFSLCIEYLCMCMFFSLVHYYLFMSLLLYCSQCSKYITMMSPRFFHNRQVLTDQPRDTEMLEPWPCHCVVSGNLLSHILYHNRTTIRLPASYLLYLGDRATTPNTLLIVFSWLNIIITARKTLINIQIIQKLITLLAVSVAKLQLVRRNFDTKY